DLALAYRPRATPDRAVAVGRARSKSASYRLRSRACDELPSWRQQASSATAKFEHRRTGRQQGKEPIVPPFVVPAGRSAIGIPRKSVPLVVNHDSIFETFHGHACLRTQPQATMVWQARRTSRDRG